jgi:hypothetical protein
MMERSTESACRFWNAAVSRYRLFLLLKYAYRPALPHYLWQNCSDRWLGLRSQV